MEPLKKIIFTDDEEDITTIAKIALEDLEHVSVKYCRSGQETLKEALTFKPDLIILDVMMPDMDGVTTLKALKLIPTLASIPVIFITAKSRRDEIEEYRQCQIIDIISKPFDPITLPGILTKIWEDYQKRLI